MSSSQASKPDGSATPESIFVDWLERCEAGEEADFEVLCADNPAHRKRLLELFDHWKELEDLRRSFGLAGSVSAYLDKHFGSGVRPKVDLDEGAEGDFTLELLGRLAGRGSTSARYRMKGEIATGGMGAVLRVWDEDLRRYLAMKVMLAKDAAADAKGAAGVDRRRLARFLEEAQVTGQLDHPGVVPVHELGLDAEGRVYFTMKLVKGRDLKTIFDLVVRGEEGWSQVKALGVLLRVCEAMSYAHDKGVIHRDLKPANVMVGRFGEVHVMDWGLARVLDREDSKDIRLADEPPSNLSLVLSDRRATAEDGSDSPLLTLDGDVVGTPAYMPPEQAAGRIADMGPHSDVYAVGAMLYHLITGHVPYVPDGTKVNNFALWHRVQEGPPPPLAEEAPDAPEELAAICGKAMARDSARRYPTMTALAADLSAFLEGRVVRAYETGAWAEARKWVRRNWQLASALAAAVALLVVGLVASSSLYVKAQHNERVALAETEKVLRLSDAKRLQEYETEADLLWPARPEKAGEMRRWLDKSKQLLANLPVHMETLLALRARALGAEGPDVPAQQRAWQFADTETQWQHDLLAELVEGLERLGSPDPFQGRIASVERRLEFAESIEARSRSGPDAARRWAEALPAIAASPHYGGLRITRQLGLLPLGTDPDSGLWEFAHLESGPPASRGPDGRLVLADDTGIVFVLIPGGEFWMGAQTDAPDQPGFDPQARQDEAPVRRMRVSPFFLSKYEMTQAQWAHVTGRNPSRWAAGQEFVETERVVTPRYPVDMVSWIDCRDTLARLGLVMPTEPQWEYAARARTTSPWFTGSDGAELQGYANISEQRALQKNTLWQEAEAWDDGYAVHGPVGSFRPNSFGLHDTAGNVWEWCRDGYEEVYRTEQVDGDVEPFEAEPKTERCIRGGTYYTPTSYARSARRYKQGPNLVLPFLGMRPARELER